mmetsp:Transcript_32951/g.79712  ORF Transcript_32951/g.79712 Transcript_32951/m.79712 type:complete len:233 (-) Transcript_32951:1571-2269(-)
MFNIRTSKASGKRLIIPDSRTVSGVIVQVQIIVCVLKLCFKVVEHTLHLVGRFFWFLGSRCFFWCRSSSSSFRSWRWCSWSSSCFTLRIGVVLGKSSTPVHLTGLEPKWAWGSSFDKLDGADRVGGTWSVVDGHNLLSHSQVTVLQKTIVCNGSNQNRINLQGLAQRNTNLAIPGRLLNFSDNGWSKLGSQDLDLLSLEILHISLLLLGLVFDVSSDGAQFQREHAFGGHYL